MVMMEDYIQNPSAGFGILIYATITAPIIYIANKTHRLRLEINVKVLPNARKSLVTYNATFSSQYLLVFWSSQPLFLAYCRDLAYQDRKASEHSKCGGFLT